MQRSGLISDAARRYSLIYPGEGRARTCHTKRRGGHAQGKTVFNLIVHPTDKAIRLDFAACLATKALWPSDSITMIPIFALLQHILPPDILMWMNGMPTIVQLSMASISSRERRLIHTSERCQLAFVSIRVLIYRRNIIWLADTNYRIDLEYDQAIQLAESDDYDALFAVDQVAHDTFSHFMY